MKSDDVLAYLRATAAGLRLQATGYSSSSKVRAGLNAQADALDAYTAVIAALPADAAPSVLLLLI